MADDLKVKLEFRSIPLPPEKRAEWDAAMQILTRMIFEALRESDRPAALSEKNDSTGKDYEDGNEPEKTERPSGN
jgi:hypothetical protein